MFSFRHVYVKHTSKTVHIQTHLAIKNQFYCICFTLIVCIFILYFFFAQFETLHTVALNSNNLLSTAIVWNTFLRPNPDLFFLEFSYLLSNDESNLCFAAEIRQASKRLCVCMDTAILWRTLLTLSGLPCKALLLIVLDKICCEFQCKMRRSNALELLDQFEELKSHYIVWAFQ